MSSDLNELLEKAKNLLKDEVTNISYETWIKGLEIVSNDGFTITLSASSVFQKEAVETRYYDLIVNTFKFVTNRDCKIIVVLQEDIQADMDEEASDLETTSEKLEYVNSCLNPKYTFDTFVVGNNNRFAHAASLAVAESPASSYNPLFLYGGVGLGKTHLMHAIGNQVLKNNKNAKVLYVTSEKFTNQLINAIKDYKNEQFRTRYRNIDVLLVDDIQFIAGKEKIQEEFFHTFNALHESGKQIIISSDIPPKDINPLEDRLKSRFEWGLLADLSNPEYETRLAILKKKAQSEKLIVEDDILSNIAAKVDSNIRELEGVLNKLIVQSSLLHGPITIEMAEKAINDMIISREKVISAEYIQDVVCKYFNIDKRDLKSSKRSNDIAYPRQIAMYLCRDIAGMSFPKIGDEFGKRDHTTIMHGFSKIEKELKENTNTKLIVESVKNIILNSK